MNVLIVLVPVSLILSAVALLTFLWTLKSAQYEDLDGDAWRILAEDEEDVADRERGARAGHPD